MENDKHSKQSHIPSPAQCQLGRVFSAAGDAHDGLQTDNYHNPTQSTDEINVVAEWLTDVRLHMIGRLTLDYRL